MRLVPKSCIWMSWPPSSPLPYRSAMSGTCMRSSLISNREQDIGKSSSSFSHKSQRNAASLSCSLEVEKQGRYISLINDLTCIYHIPSMTNIVSPSIYLGMNCWLWKKRLRSIEVYHACAMLVGAYIGPVRLSEFWRNLDGLEECWRNLWEKNTVPDEKISGSSRV